MEKIRIGITINYLAVGGSQSFAFALADGLGKCGHLVFVYDFNLPFYSTSLSELHSPLLDSQFFSFHQYKLPVVIALFQKIKFLNIGMTWLLNFSRVARFRRFVIENKIQLVSSHLMAADTLSAFALQDMKDVVHCVTMHGSYEGFPKAIVKKKREVTFTRVNGVVYLTPRNIEFLSIVKSKNPKLRYKQIYNGYNHNVFTNDMQVITRAELHIPADAFVFIQVARGAEDKGWSESIRAFLRLKEEVNANVVLLLVGDGEYLSILKEKYHTFPEIIFYGYSGNPIPLIQISNVGMLPTYYKGESLPNTVIEYLFCGKPVLASNIGEIKNMIGAGTSLPAGYTFNLSAGGPIIFSELIEKMASYVSNSSLYKEHAANTQIQIAKFRMEYCISQYEEFFFTLLNSK